MPESFQRMRHQWLSTQGLVASEHLRLSSSWRASVGPKIVGVLGVENRTGDDDAVWNE